MYIIIPGLDASDSNIGQIELNNRNDPRLRAGSLVLFDPSKLTTLPTVNTSVLNVAWVEAAANIGSGDINSLALPITTQVANMPGGFLEFTEKKGLHMSVLLGSTGGNGIVWVFPDLIKQYLLDNPTNDYYFSMWVRNTRLNTTATYQKYRVTNSVEATDNNLFIFETTTTRPSSVHTPTLGNAEIPSINHLGISFRDVGTPGWKGTVPSNISNLIARLTIGSESTIMYDFYAEDLTVSNRSYEQAHAQVYGLYQAAFATGGKFHNDTFTPAL